MCGIVGYAGSENVSENILSGLSKLEYRGYDSAGIAMPIDNGIYIKKSKGALASLRELLAKDSIPDSRCGIGHTRWATHGAPSDINAHPHMGMNGKIAVVHNGIIENDIELREALKQEGIKFVSDTDTEVIAQLVEYYYSGNTAEAVVKATEKLQGAFAIGVISKDNPNEIIATRKDNPLIVGLSDKGNYIASDIPAFLDCTRKYMIMNDGELVKIKSNSVEVYNLALEQIEKEVLTATWDIDAAEKGGYEHFMLKEINAQPNVLKETINPRFSNGGINFSESKMSDDYLASINHIHIVACGSAWHAGLIGKTAIERLTRVRTDTYLASEFRYNEPIVNEGDLCIIISQSGETADTVAALRKAKELGAKILSIVNVVGSTIARESDDVLYTWAGPEISVASTKAYSTQLSVFYLFAVKLAEIKKSADPAVLSAIKNDLKKIPENVSSLFAQTEKVKSFAEQFHNVQNAFFIGRGVDYAVALESSLKLKEISYIHAEAFAAGELKHGPISLIEKGTLVVVIATQEDLCSKILSSVEQLKARGATVIVVTNEDCTLFDSQTDFIIKVPKIQPLLSASLAVVPLQIFAYYMAILRGCNVDKPRNLAKSVTVE